MSEPIELKIALEQFAESHASELVAIEKDIKSLIAGDVDANLNRIEGHLGALYADAEAANNSVAMQQIADSWELTQQLAIANQQLLGIATGATYGMNKAFEQRDELIEAVVEQDTSNPLVGNLVEELSEQFAYEWLMSDYEGTQAEALEVITEHAQALLGMEHEAAYRLAHILAYGYTGYGDNVIPDETLLSIGRFISEKLKTVGKANV